MRLRLSFAYTATMAANTQHPSNPGNGDLSDNNTPDTRTSGTAATPALSADDRLTLMLAALIAARMVSDMEPREFQGMRSPRYESAMAHSLAVAQSLIKRHRAWLLQCAK